MEWSKRHAGCARDRTHDLYKGPKNNIPDVLWKRTCNNHPFVMDVVSCRQLLQEVSVKPECVLYKCPPRDL